MIDIFLSRPSWVSPEFEGGLATFQWFLKQKGVLAHTLGQTDYPSESPLDEVIKLMNRCRGAIVLGYPQIEISVGKIKDVDISAPVFLATEWNHIEASLAYSLKLPLLVIHDNTVSRGIFDLGALNSFAYSTDLSNDNWPMQKEITGACSAWIDLLA